MGKVNKESRMSGIQCRRVTPYPLPSRNSKILDDCLEKKKGSKSSEKKDWEEATCAVCMEYPHNAVLLLCSSYNKGCRPYMCATGHHYSNCLDQYKKAYTKFTVMQSSSQVSHGSLDDPSFGGRPVLPDEKMEVSELLCPLCRGQVKGWTVVEPARKYLNKKKRTCMQDACSFTGTYKDLRKHVRAEHPSACPREVDPLLAEKWKKFEHERELNDVLSTIRSTMPGAVVMGDYVIEGNHRGFAGDYDVDEYVGDAFRRLESYGGDRSDSHHSYDIFERGYHSWDEEDVELLRGGLMAGSGRVENYISRVGRHRNRVRLGGLRRARGHRAAYGHH